MTPHNSSTDTAGLRGEPAGLPFEMGRAQQSPRGMGQVHQGDLVSDQGRQLRELGVVQAVLGIEHRYGGALALFELTFFRLVKDSGKCRAHFTDF